MNFAFPNDVAQKIGLSGKPIIRSELAYFAGEARQTQRSSIRFVFASGGCDPANGGQRVTIQPGNPSPPAAATSAPAARATAIRGTGCSVSTTTSSSTGSTRTSPSSSPRSSSTSTSSGAAKRQLLPGRRASACSTARCCRCRGTTSRNPFSVTTPAEPVLIHQPTDQFLQTLLIFTSYYSGQVTPSMTFAYDWSGSLLAQPQVTLSRDPFRFTFSYSYLCGAPERRQRDQPAARSRQRAIPDRIRHLTVSRPGAEAEPAPSDRRVSNLFHKRGQAGIGAIVTPYIRRFSVLAASWCVLSALPAVAAQDSFSIREIRQNLFSACFTGEKDGWVVGELGRVFHTTDGGKTFSRSDTGTRAAFLSVACLPDGSVVITGSEGPGDEEHRPGRDLAAARHRRRSASCSASPSRPRRSASRSATSARSSAPKTAARHGRSVPLPTGFALPEDIAEIVDPGDVLLYDVEFANAERGWAVGEFGVIFTTADGGKTWTAQKSPVQTTLFGVHFADPQRGWATGIEQVLLRTTDGGETWTKMDVGSAQRVRARPLRCRRAGSGGLGDRRQRPAAAQRRRRRDLDAASSCRSGWRAIGSAASPCRLAPAGSSSAATGRSC